MCCKCQYILLLIIFGVLFYIFLPSEYFASWITALSTLAMAIIASKALGTWKKEIEYKFVSDLRKDLVKALSDLYFSLNLHANYYATSDNTLKENIDDFDYKKEKLKIDNEFAYKQREVAKTVYSYALYKQNQKKFLENLVNELNVYKNNVLDLINIRIQIQSEENSDVDTSKKNEIEEKIQCNNKTCEKLMKELKEII